MNQREKECTSDVDSSTELEAEPPRPNKVCKYSKQYNITNVAFHALHRVYLTIFRFAEKEGCRLGFSGIAY